MSSNVLTIIEWTDSYAPTDGPWVSTSECAAGSDEPLPIITVGFVFKETAQYVAVCASAALTDLAEPLKDAEAFVAGVLFIPHTQIRKRLTVDVLGPLADAAPLVWKAKGYPKG